MSARVLSSTFHRLDDRLHNYNNQLSDGEQQMLAIGRALIQSMPEMQTRYFGV